MAKFKFELPPDLSKQLATMASELTTFLEEAREEFDNRSDTWRDSDTGAAVDAWLERLENLCDDLENVADEPDV